MKAEDSREATKFPVILREHATPAGRDGAGAGRYVLCEIDHEITPFATWWESSENGARRYAHYFENRANAEADFERRMTAEPITVSA